MAAKSNDSHNFPWSSPNNDFWACPACTFENPRACHPQCSMCKEISSKPIEDLLSAQLEAIWVCPACTLINAISDVECKACGKPKSKSVSVLLNQ